MGHFKRFLEMVDRSRLLAPNLKVMTLRYYTGNRHRGNYTARQVMQNHLLALRWMNPNAVVYLREYKGQGCPEVDLELWSGEKHTMEIAAGLSENEIVAKVLMAARDPVEDERSGAAESSSSGARAADSALSSPRMSAKNDDRARIRATVVAATEPLR